MPQLDLDDLAEKATDLEQVRRSARRLSAIFAIVGIASILADGPWIGAAALIVACLAAVMDWIVWPRTMKATKTDDAPPR